MLTFPLALSEFWDLLPISSIALDCEPQLEMSGTAAGQQLTRQIAPALWRGPVTLDKLTPNEAAEAMALVDFARQSGGSFMMYDLMRPYPVMDPKGDVLDAANVVVSAIAADRRSLRLAGLPPNYQIRRGDMLGSSWGAAPIRYGLHRIALASSADGTGVTDWNWVSPEIHSAVLVGSPVTLTRPAIKGMIVPKSVRKGSMSRGLVMGTSFEVIQTLR